MQDASAVPALLGLLTDPDARVRADVAFALGQSADSTAALALVNALDREEDPIVVIELLEALGKTGSRASLASLITLDLPRGTEAGRAMAIARYGLRGIYDPAATAWAAVHLRSGDLRVREAAAYLFGRSRSADYWLPHAAAVRAAFDQPRARDEARPALASALGRLRDPQDEQRLTRALREDSDWRVRVTAARVLPALAETAPTVWPSLAAALDDPNDHVARSAAEALAGATELPAPVVERLARWVAANGARPLVTGSVLPALARAGRTGDVTRWLDALRAAARSSRSRSTTDVTATHRALGVSALGVASDATSLAHLFTATRDTDPRIAYAAVEALKTRWAAGRESAAPAEARRFYDAFAAAVARRDLATTSAAAPALTDSLFRPFGPGALLRATYARMVAPRDIEPMVEIVRAAGQIRDGSEVDFLVSVAMMGHPVLRQAADDALDERLHEGIDVDATNPVPPMTVLIEWDYLRELGPRPLLVLDTERGTIIIEMDSEQAPQTVTKLAKTVILGHFNDVPFHRVVANFVIQGGDYFRRDGYGGPDVNLRSEFTRMRYTTGTAGMASAGKDTEGVQYFFTHSATPHLDGRYTSFGRVVAGQDVVDAIQPGELVHRASIIRTSERRAPRR